MNKIDAHTRILRNLQIIRYQVESLNRSGLAISMYCELAIGESLNATTGYKWTNLNSTRNNHPAIDLLSPDGSRGVQATLHVTKGKLNKTVDALVKELNLVPSRLDRLRRVDVVGLTCVNSPGVTASQVVNRDKKPVEIRGIALERLLDLPSRSADELEELDQALQGLATITPYQLRSDAEELELIIEYLDRPAIRDHRNVELDWVAMQDAMVSIRRLLTQGANDSGHSITRPYPTFQPEVSSLLKEICKETSAISLHLRSELHVRGSLRESDARKIDGHRLRIQEIVNELAAKAVVASPLW